MAALDGKITIGLDYRPCMVHIPEISENMRNMSGKLTTRVLKEAEERKALFRCWGYRSELYGASPMYGGHPGGQIWRLRALPTK